MDFDISRFICLPTFPTLLQPAFYLAVKRGWWWDRGLTCTHAFATCCVSVCALQTPWLRTLGVRPNLSKRKDCIILSLCTFDFPEMRRFIYLYFMWVSCCNAVMTTCDMHAATGSSGEIFEAPTLPTLVIDTLFSENVGGPAFA